MANQLCRAAPLKPSVNEKEKKLKTTALKMRIMQERQKHGGVCFGTSFKVKCTQEKHRLSSAAGAKPEATNVQFHQNKKDNADAQKSAGEF